RETSGWATSPPAKTISCTPASRQTVTSRRFDSALVTETPTPCKPPEKLYAPPAALSNLPPACSRVKTISTTGIFSSGWAPTGMPRPSSSTEMLPSACSVRTISRQKPARASSAALSITSCTTCSGFSVRVYMPGRWRTGSRPLRTRMDASLYSLRRAAMLRGVTEEREASASDRDAAGLQQRCEAHDQVGIAIGEERPAEHEAEHPQRRENERVAGNAVHAMIVH